MNNLLVKTKRPPAGHLRVNGIVVKHNIGDEKKRKK